MRVVCLFISFLLGLVFADFFFFFFIISLRVCHCTRLSSSILALVFAPYATNISSFFFLGGSVNKILGGCRDVIYYQAVLNLIQVASTWCHPRPLWFDYWLFESVSSMRSAVQCSAVFATGKHDNRFFSNSNKPTNLYTYSLCNVAQHSQLFI